MVAMAAAARRGKLIISLEDLRLKFAVGGSVSTTTLRLSCGSRIWHLAFHQAMPTWHRQSTTMWKVICDRPSCHRPFSSPSSSRDSPQRRAGAAACSVSASADNHPLLASFSIGADEDAGFLAGRDAAITARLYPPLETQIAACLAQEAPARRKCWRPIAPRL